MKKCSKCKIEKSLDEFNFKIKSTGTRQSYCKVCSRLFVKNHYNNNKSYYLSKARKRNLAIRHKVITYVKDYLLKNPCVDCGESDIVVLDFDHQEGTCKISSISSLIRNRSSIQLISDEIKKCQVRCANCHRKRTAKQFNWLKNNALVAQRIEHSPSKRRVVGSIPTERTDT